MTSGLDGRPPPNCRVELPFGHRLLLPRSGRGQREGRWTPLSCGTRARCAMKSSRRFGAPHPAPGRPPRSPRTAVGRRRRHMASGSLVRVSRQAAVDGRTITSYLIDMDGVLVHEDQPIPGADRFIKALDDKGLRYLVMTNNSIFTQRDLSARLARAGIRIPPERLWTSALATAQFLD